ncbi:hypothetical protein [Paenibacillus alkalitolerans]|uniref:hypothetical protein n=1 Tax=Paenibacillus alkalitolerans TaxID=2799335 RepID=UPI0018F532A4|nr:hypothetical protein [Paenibacillus alkalitolerans]
MIIRSLEQTDQVYVREIMGGYPLQFPKFIIEKYDLGSKQVILYTLGHVGNEATLLFYRKIGFEMVKYEKDFFRPGYDKVTLVKHI